MGDTNPALGCSTCSREHRGKRPSASSPYLPNGILDIRVVCWMLKSQDKEI